MYDFEIERPASVADAVKALGREDAQPLSGGQTLIPTLKARLAMPSVLVSLTGIEGLKGVEMRDGALWIGGGTTHATVMRDAAESYPALASLAARIGDPAVRNRGTIGGSLANNDPSACYPAGALVSGATIETDRREIAADDYFQGMFTTALEEGEIVTGVRFPIPQAAHYEKFIQPPHAFRSSRPMSRGSATGCVWQSRVRPMKGSSAGRRPKKRCRPALSQARLRGWPLMVAV